MYGTAVRDCGTDSCDDRRADANTHRSAHEGEVLHPDDDFVPVELASSIDQRVALAVGGSRRLEAVGVALGIAEPQRVFANFGSCKDFILGSVEQLLEAFRRADPVVEIAARTDAVILFPFLDEHHRPALGALVPQILGGLALGKERNAASNSA